MKNNKQLLRLLICLLFTTPSVAQTSEVSGILKKWHKITVSVNIPSTIFYETHSTFADHRLDVIFTNQFGTQVRVPGFFAADGNAANTGATVGSQFKAYLRPDATGSWTYKALFYKGTGVATMPVGSLPSPTYTLNGVVGSIGANDKSAPDLRSKGRLEYQSTGSASEKRYLRFNQTGEYFLKLGPDSPENLLNYADFDFADVRNTCGRCRSHTYTPHVVDYELGDPTWKNGKGTAIIGALNYLRNQEINAISMSLYGGDDLNVFPWTKASTKSIYDVSKLEQWEIVMDHAEQNGLLLHLKLAENENWDLLSSTQLKIYYREMVARFGHHLALEWNISEEYRGSAVSSIERIDWLAAIDPWQNHRVIHTYPGEHSKYEDWLQIDAKLTGASIQSPDTNSYDDVYNSNSGILYWIDKSKSYDSPWVVSSDEQNSGVTGVFTSSSISNSTVVDEARTRVLWKTLIAGGSGVMWYGGGVGDFSTEDFSRFVTLFKWSRYAIQDFFVANGIAFWKSENRDDLVGGTVHCLAEIGNSYVVYMENGGTTTLNLSGNSSAFNVRWFDPRNGGFLQTGSVTRVNGGGVVSIGSPPSATTSDWVALITTDAVQGPTSTCEADFEEKDKRVIIEAENLNISGTSWVKRTEESASTGNGYISWEGANHFGTPGNDIVSATIKINNPGKYRFQWRNTFGQGSNTTEHNDSWLRFADASDFYAERGTSKVYPVGSGKTPNPSAGGGSKGFFKVWLSGDGNWSWYSRTWDSNSHYIYVEFDTPGVYTMEISGRSKYHLLDRIILYQEGVNAQSLSLEENPCSNTPTVTNAAPTAAITAPTTGQQYTIGDPINLVASATDSDGYITRVEFYYDGGKIGEDSNAPYLLTTTAKNLGSHVITAKAYDNKGATTLSSVKTINVISETNAAPTVTLTSPANGQKYEVGDTINYTASATDSDGYIIRVEFYANGSKIGEDSNSPYTLQTSARYIGDYAITARAIDNNFKSTISASRSIRVVAPIATGDSSPIVSMSAPANGQKYEVGEVMNFVANAADDGYIARVEFYSNGAKIGEDSRAPYICRPITAQYVGNYVITAKAMDNNGNSTISNPITISIVDPVTSTNQNPVVRIITPSTAITSTVKNNVAITAAAGDADGTIAKVEFYAKGVIKIGEDTSYPYNANFFPIFEGKYPITAKATDNDGNVKTSLAVVITVVKGAAPVPVVVEKTVTLSPIHDAYTDYNNGYNNSLVRVEKGRREMYFMFDISGLSDEVTDAHLMLTVNSDSGSGLLHVNKGLTNSWTETTLSSTTKPSLGDLVGTKTGTYGLGTKVDVPIVTTAIQGDILTLVVTQQSGNDVAFASKESSTAAAPQLVVSYEDTRESKSYATAKVPEAVQSELVVYPNPTIETVYLEGNQLQGASIQIFSITGLLLQQQVANSNRLKMNVNDMPSGIYLLKTLLLDGHKHTERLVIQR